MFDLVFVCHLSYNDLSLMLLRQLKTALMDVVEVDNFLISKW